MTDCIVGALVDAEENGLVDLVAELSWGAGEWEVRSFHRERIGGDSSPSA